MFEIIFTFEIRRGEMSSIEADPIGESLDRLTNDSDTAMVYGFFRFGVNQVQEKLERLGKEVFSYSSLASDYVPKSFSVIIQRQGKDSLNDECKTSLTNFVIENYLRSLRGDKISPFIFCIDSNKNGFPKFDLSDPTNYQEIKQLHLITVSELRRAYKLCYDRSVDPTIRRIALLTFRFIKVDLDKNRNIQGFRIISPPWANPKPFLMKQGQEKCRDPKNWRYQVNTVVNFISQRKEK